ncbi:MAG TPA: ABC transporter permease [Anaerolineales bacterium]|nr:ABC transporter permease [Anaerolineales bacterium]
MNHIEDMVWIESRKAIRSKMPLFTALGSLLMPLGIGFLIFLAKNPDLSRDLGLLGAKADLTAYFATDWPSYLGLFALIIAAAGFFLFVLIISWVFGREFADGTLKDMLAVPVSRSSILMAKFAVVAVWSGMLTAGIFGLGLVMGAVIKLPNGSMDVLLHGGASVVIAACLVFAVVLPFAFLASVGRGYLLPIGVAVLTLIMANLLMVAGWGDYFPWGIPAIYAQGQDSLPPISYMIVILTGLGGIVATYLWWKHADQSR